MAYDGLPGDPIGMPSVWRWMIPSVWKCACSISKVEIRRISLKVSMDVDMLYGSRDDPKTMSPPFWRSIVIALRRACLLCVTAWLRAKSMAFLITSCGSSEYMFLISAQYVRKRVFGPQVFLSSSMCRLSVRVMCRTFQSVNDLRPHLCKMNASARPLRL